MGGVSRGCPGGSENADASSCSPRTNAARARLLGHRRRIGVERESYQSRTSQPTSLKRFSERLERSSAPARREAEAPSEAQWSHNLAQTWRWAGQLRSTANHFARNRKRVGDEDYQRSIDGLIGRADVSLWASGEGALRVVTQRWPLRCGDSLDPLNGPVGILRDVPHGAPFTARRNSSSLRGVNRQLAGPKSFTHEERCRRLRVSCHAMPTPPATQSASEVGSGTTADCVLGAWKELRGVTPTSST